MRMLDLIIKKRDGKKLSKEEIFFIVNGYIHNLIPDYQVSALLMAVYFRGMDDDELYDLTDAMKQSGKTITFPQIKHSVYVDKHSTGGIGDKTTLAVAPIVAACGLKIGKMSGRSLGYAGGTVDKLESILGYKVEVPINQFISNVENYGICLSGQSEELVPGDKYIYSLRDCSGCVESIPLIASSIMSKKLAINSSCLVLDVKYGDGAFMKTEKDADLLAQKMISIGKKEGRNVAVFLNEIKEPLGYCIGNALEVQEIISFLTGEKIPDLEENCIHLAAILLCLANGDGMEKNMNIARRTIEEGSALEKFKTMLSINGVDLSKGLDHLLPIAKYKEYVYSKSAGYVNRIHTQECGKVSMLLGAGREYKNDKIDYSAGIRLLVKSGDYVKENDPLAILYSNSIEKIETQMLVANKLFDIESICSYKKPKYKILW